MPIYEYRCLFSCHRKTTALVLSRERAAAVRCHHCGSADLEKLWSRFASPKGEEARLEALADESSLSGLDENDPASVARYMKKMGEAMGEDLGDDVEAAMEEAEGADSLEHGGSDAD